MSSAVHRRNRPTLRLPKRGRHQKPTYLDREDFRQNGTEISGYQPSTETITAPAKLTFARPQGQSRSVCETDEIKRNEKQTCRLPGRPGRSGEKIECKSIFVA